jgi:membrane associated rhomboid family serine protease
MVLPIADDNSDRTITPWVNYTLIGLNVFVFVVLQGFGMNDDFTYAYSEVPEEIVTGKDIVTSDQEVIDPVTKQPMTDPYTGDPVTLPGLRPTWPSVYVTLLTSMFMHGGFLHLAGNLLFLWIFGDNIEDYLGHVRYAVFYLTCGLLSSFTQIAATYLFHGNPLIPTLGASGAISGVLGGYLLLFPQRRVTVILLRILTQVPAWVAIGMWFVFQIISALGILGEGSQVGGVAYGAHIGGFVGGLALVKVFGIGREKPTPGRFREDFYQRW